MFKQGDQLRQFILVERLCPPTGLSEIWRVVHHRTQRRAIMKIALTWDLPGQKSVGEFANSLVRNEADILPHLSHPGIVQIFPLVTPDDEVEYVARASNCRTQIKPWYFVMKYIEGFPLSDCMEEVMAQTFEWRMELFYQLLITIEYMHMNGYAHMDLKPENIMIGAIDPAAQPKVTLIDLGCASTDPSKLTTEPGGTEQYAPLELLLAMRSDLIEKHGVPPVIPIKADIWSLGVIYFEIVTGTALFSQKDSARNIRDTLLKEKTRTISEFARNTPDPERLDRFLNLMLKRNAPERADIGLLIQYMDQQIAPPPRL